MSDRPDSANLADALRRRLAFFREFERWETTERAVLTPQQALSAATGLFDLLPLESRHRPADPAGVMTLHALLARLRGHL